MCILSQLGALNAEAPHVISLHYTSLAGICTHIHPVGSFVDQEPNPQTQLTPASSCVVKRLINGQVIALQRPLRGGGVVELCGVRVRVRVRG